MFFLLLLACSGKDARQPGTLVGSFRVEGKKQMATCGDPTAAPDPWTFDVRFSRDRQTLYWVQNRAPISGTISADRKVTLTMKETQVVRQPDRFGRGGCAVTRSDTFSAVLGPDEPLGDAGTGGFSSLEGTLSYAFAPDPGSDCAGLEDPGLSVLPCAIVYGVHANKVTP